MLKDKWHKSHPLLYKHLKNLLWWWWFSCGLQSTRQHCGRMFLAAPWLLLSSSSLQRCLREPADAGTNSRLVGKDPNLKSLEIHGRDLILGTMQDQDRTFHFQAEIRKQALFFLKNPGQFVRWRNKLLIPSGTPEAGENSLNLILRHYLKDLTRDASCSCSWEAGAYVDIVGQSHQINSRKEKPSPWVPSCWLSGIFRYFAMKFSFFLLSLQSQEALGFTDSYQFIFNFSKSLYLDNLESSLWLPMEALQGCLFI